MTHCIVVGAGLGLGEAIARKFGSNGFHISLIARRDDVLHDQCKRLGDAGISTQFRVCDASDHTRLRGVISKLETEFGPCSVMIYNAAVLRPQEPLGLEVETLREEFDVNLIGALAAAQTVAPGMVSRGEGAILFTGGGLALEPYPEWSSLALGKSALRSLAFSLYKTLAPQGVHVAVIAVCGIVEPGGLFDPDNIAQEYFRLATRPEGVKDREAIIQPEGSDPCYNDPDRQHAETSILPAHAQK